jgi:CubicO group peptidase (beta-lactamase class C family)
MTDTYFFVPEEKLSRLATAYTWYEGKGLNRFPDKPIAEGAFEYSADYAYRAPKKLYAGGAGLSSTAADYARFCQMVLSGGTLDGKRLLGRKSVELMTHDQLGAISRDQAFGLGFGVSGVKSPLAEVGSPGQYGWGGFFYTLFFIDPKEDRRAEPGPAVRSAGLPGYRRLIESTHRTPAGPVAERYSACRVQVLKLRNHRPAVCAKMVPRY